MSIQKHQSSLERFVEQSISDVSFIGDHVQVSAHGLELTCQTWPVVCVSGDQFHLGDAEYRDKLCAFIGRPVRSVRELEREALTLVFDGEDTINISLRNEDCRGVEAAMLGEERGEVFEVWPCEGTQAPRCPPLASNPGKVVTPAEEHESVLEYMIGREILEICFVMDYVQVRAEGMRLTCFTVPTVCVSGQRFELGMAGYRDKLCAFIGRSVRSVSERKFDALTLIFDGGDTIGVSLREEDFRGPEAAMLSMQGGKIWEVYRND